MIYFVEDDLNIRNLVIYTLENTGFEALGFETAGDFWRALKENTPELILLDIMLPDEDGLQILKKLKGNPKTKTLPVMMLSAKGTEFDKVLGLDLGADDYLPKPFGMMELVARVKNLLRRTLESTAQQEYRVGNLYVNIPQHRIQVDDKKVALTLKEFEVLTYLLENRGNVLNRDQILLKIWGFEFDGETRTVDVHIRTLRQKLGEAGDLVETVRGVGYRIKGEM